jgi:hypothetical protein
MEIAQARKRRVVFLILLSLAFLFRLGFGVCSEFWNADEKQVYLIGLKYYTTGAWPYFGPDVTNTIQVPGALQGLTAGLPFYLLPIPEAPYILLNILSFAALCFFAWYCTKRLPEAPKWFIWAWLLTAPWTLNLSTHIFNPSYVLFGAILFFVGVTETYPFMTRKLIPLHWANLMMGLALLWVMQFHMSWPILLPFLLVSFYFQYRTRGLDVFKSLGWFAAGAVLTGSFLIPTYLKYGLRGGLGSTNEVVQFNSANVLRSWNVAEGILGRFLSFASYELPRFIGENTGTRLAFMENNPWLIPVIIFLGIIGILQPVALVVLWFRKKHTQRDWRAMKYLTLATVCLIYVGFAFSFRPPYSHMYYVAFPVVMLYSLYCWSEYLKQPRWQKFALVFIISGIIFSAGLAHSNYKSKSLYVNRHLPQAAIDAKDYRILDERREGARY